MDSLFASLEDSNSDQICEEVPITITGTFHGTIKSMPFFPSSIYLITISFLLHLFLADEDGSWNTNSSFQYNRALYTAVLSGLKFTPSQWTESMTTITEKFRKITSLSPKRDLAWNLVLFLISLSNYHTIYPLL